MTVNCFKTIINDILMTILHLIDFLVFFLFCFQNFLTVRSKL